MSNSMSSNECIKNTLSSICSNMVIRLRICCCKLIALIIYVCFLCDTPKVFEDFAFPKVPILSNALLLPTII